MGWVSCQEDNDKRSDDSDLTLAMNRYYPSTGTSVSSHPNHSIVAQDAKTQIVHRASSTSSEGVQQPVVNRATSRKRNRDNTSLSASFAAAIVRERMDEEYRRQGKLVDKVQHPKKSPSPRIVGNNRFANKAQNQRTFQTRQGNDSSTSKQFSRKTTPPISNNKQLMQAKSVVCRALRTLNTYWRMGKFG